MLGSFIRMIVPAKFRPVTYLCERTLKQAGGAVVQGPFKGMKYLSSSYFSCYIPKVLGIYERELYPVIETACGMGLGLVIDIGAAEGYFAVGMAMRNPKANVIAYEMSDPARAMLTQMAAMNGMSDHIQARGFCSRATLSQDLTAAKNTTGGPSLVICDCEAFELVLLDPLRVPELQQTYVLVELHDFIIPGIAEELTDRFSATHHVERIWQTDRDPSEYPYPSLYTKMLPRKRMEWAVSEWRPEKMSWLWMRPKA